MNSIMYIAKITHCPFGDMFISKDNMDQVTELSSEGLNYMQFCNLIGQTILHFQCVNVELRIEFSSKPETQKP